MADPEVRIGTPAEEDKDDLEMGDDAAEDDAEREETAGLGNIEPELPKRTTFLDYLRSPIVEIVVGTGPDATTLSAHQALLVQSPYFEEETKKFSTGLKRRIVLVDEDIEAVGSFLEYLYNGEYFPRRLGPDRASELEIDPSIPQPDDEGAQLLRHARVYTIATKFGMPSLKSLAHSKIHRTQATAKGEIAYARFVYKETTPEDHTIRKPVAAFWATRSHVLRHEAGDEFRRMCLEFPQFGYDVLTLVLDQKERRGERQGTSEVMVQPSAPDATIGKRKRARVSQG